ncbi:type VII secretion target [Gordonia phthalatica]|uniref:ESX-1 secretion-associated protein n=1 Tax=Gordonia phthalatica TaxID=1136941 RepID=A0A0N9NFW0_9ACTN|nr:type VII secretion target [Gordonia phthalatica]ALG84228.1 hypothetical protein ACH46_06545 [Gordonia phthalatica]
MNGQTGTSVTVDPAAASTVVSTQASAAGGVAARSVAERVDTAALLPTFGLIGAGFLAALNGVGAARTASLDALASRHASTAARTAAAAAAYECCDADGGADLAGVPA